MNRLFRTFHTTPFLVRAEMDQLDIFQILAYTMDINGYLVTNRRALIRGALRGGYDLGSMYVRANATIERNNHEY